MLVFNHHTSPNKCLSNLEYSMIVIKEYTNVTSPEPYILCKHVSWEELHDNNNRILQPILKVKNK